MPADPRDAGPDLLNTTALRKIAEDLNGKDWVNATFAARHALFQSADALEAERAAHAATAAAGEALAGSVWEVLATIRCGDTAVGVLLLAAVLDTWRLARKEPPNV